MSTDQDAQDDSVSESFSGLEPMKDTKIGTSMGIAAIALNMAMKYCDITTVQDGALYQQYKLEGRNMRAMNLDVVFETAMAIEMHLLTSERRISQLIADTLVEGLKADMTAEDASAEGEEGEKRATDEQR